MADRPRLGSCAGARALTWTWRVAANLCTDRLRRRRRTTPLDAVPGPVDPALRADARMRDDARARALHAAPDRLPERQRQAVSMRNLDDLSNPQIAEIMALRVAGVRSWMIWRYGGRNGGMTMTEDDLGDRFAAARRQTDPPAAHVITAVLRDARAEAERMRRAGDPAPSRRRLWRDLPDALGGPRVGGGLATTGVAGLALRVLPTYPTPADMRGDDGYVIGDLAPV